MYLLTLTYALTCLILKSMISFERQIVLYQSVFLYRTPLYLLHTSTVQIVQLLLFFKRLIKDQMSVCI